MRPVLGQEEPGLHHRREDRPQITVGRIRSLRRDTPVRLRRTPEPWAGRGIRWATLLRRLCAVGARPQSAQPRRPEQPAKRHDWAGSLLPPDKALAGLYPENILSKS